jgi:large subunit ribosomal protein L21
MAAGSAIGANGFDNLPRLDDKPARSRPGIRPGVNECAARGLHRHLTGEPSKSARTAAPQGADNAKERTMYAVIKTGGKQYRVAPDDVITVEKIEGEAGAKVELGEVLMIGGDAPKFGSPLISGAKVVAELVEQTRGPKVIAFKKRRRKNSRRKRGHRQDLTTIRITSIVGA